MIKYFIIFSNIFKTGILFHKEIKPFMAPIINLLTESRYLVIAEDFYTFGFKFSGNFYFVYYKIILYFKKN